MDVDEKKLIVASSSTRPATLSRNASSDLDLETLKITANAAVETPTKKREPITPSKNRHSTRSVPTMSPSSSPSVDYEEIVTPQSTPTKAHAMSRTSSDLSFASFKTDSQLDGYKALKAVLRCSSASGGDVIIDDEGVAGLGPRDDLVGRAEEKAFLWRYLTGSASAETRTSEDVDMDGSASTEDKRAVYISGPPGTGKTAVVTALANNLCRQADASWKVASVNCMGLSAGQAKEDLWHRIAAAWGFVVGRGSAERAVENSLNTAMGANL
jgi:hypothetical protein